MNGNTRGRQTTAKWLPFLNYEGISGRTADSKLCVQQSEPADLADKLAGRRRYVCSQP